MAKPDGHLTPEYIAAYMKKLKWLEENPVKPISVSEKFEPPRKRAAEFHNRLTMRELR
jgi:hypothetical protein